MATPKPAPTVGAMVLYVVGGKNTGQYRPAVVVRVLPEQTSSGGVDLFVFQAAGDVVGIDWSIDGDGSAPYGHISPMSVSYEAAGKTSHTWHYPEVSK